MRKIADLFSTLVILGSIAILVAWLSIDQKVEYSGSAYIVDGDTIIIDKEKIRLEGIDAPELNQICVRDEQDYNCGNKSRANLITLAGKANISCKAWQRDKYGRLLGECFAADVNLNQRMVADGWAVAFGDYNTMENQARNSKLGLWAGSFDRPRDWRYLQADPVDSAAISGKIGGWNFW